MQQMPNLRPRALIACALSDKARLQELTMQSAPAEFELCALSEARRADLGLVDLRNASLSPDKARALAAALRRASPEAPVFFLASPEASAPARAGLRRFGEVVLAHHDVAHLITRFRQMLRLRNVAEETGERLKSLAGLNRLVEFPVIAASDRPRKLLIAGEPSASALAAINALQESADECICVLSAGQTMRALDHEEFDCAVFLQSDEKDPLFALARALRRHPRHASMAVIQIADDVEALSALAQKGARDFLLRAHVADDLQAKAHLAMRRARLLRVMERFLRTCKGECVCDPASGAFSAAFLTEHGARLCGRADDAGRPLAQTLARLTPAGKTRARLGRKALHLAARLINRVTRVEDLVARVGPEKFIVLHPATRAVDAHRVAGRIRGVLTNTSFGGDEIEKPFAINVETAVAERAAGAPIEESVAKLLRAAQDRSDVTRSPRRSLP